MQWVSRGLLAALLGTMPWAALSPAASPPSQWAALMEWFQHFSPLRTGSWEDVGFNAAGCLAGVLLFAIHGGRVALKHFWRPVRISEGK